jgi:flagellar biosynthetic protein FliR
VAGGDVPGVFAAAFAGSAAFAALLPLAGSRAVPAVVRLALALAIAPLVVAHLGAEPRTDHLLVQALGAIALGSAIGLGASIVAGSAAAAGALIDGALGASSIGSERIFGQGAGPFGQLAPLAFACVMTNSGALTWLVAAYTASAGSLAQHFTAPESAALGRTLFAAALAVALPALCAHAFGALAAGIVARLSPRVNGILLAPALGSVLVLCVLLAGTTALFDLMRELSRLVVHAAHV